MKRLAIVGSAPGKQDAPYSDKRYDIWAISGAAFSESLDGVQKPDTEDNSWNSVTRVDVFFEMHKRDVFGPRVDALNRSGRPVYMQKVEPCVPHSLPYPIEAIAAELGDEFSSSVDYMMAAAIYFGYDEIRLYGIIMGHKSEYARQRPGLKYWIGVARAKGIAVWAPEITQLTTPLTRYGYDDHDAICAMIEAKKKALDADMDAQEQKIKDLRAGYYQLRGASIYCDEIIATIRGGLL